MSGTQVDDGGKGRMTVALDLDGVLHAYSKGWHDGTIYDGPMPGAGVSTQLLLDRGYELVVFTARQDLDGIRAWLAEHLPHLAGVEVTNSKPVAALYIDDRAVRFTSWPNAVKQTLELLG